MHLTRSRWRILAALLLVTGCTHGELTRSDPAPSDPSDPADPSDPTDPTDPTDPGAGITPRTDVRMYVFGHSLAAFSEPNTAVGQAMCLVANAAGRPCCGNGQWPRGFDPSVFANFDWPPADRQGHGPSCWGGSFASSRYNVVTITEANFYFQDNSPTGIYPGHALDLVGRIRGAYPGVPVYLYEHWPPFENFSFDEWKSRYHRDFHDWFVAIQDEVNRRDPSANVKLVPVGWIFARMLSQVPELRTLRQSDLFVDTDPHGTSTTYFLSGLIHYMALYRERPPASLTAPTYVHPTVRANLGAIVDFAWRDIQTLNDARGNSRVF